MCLATMAYVYTAHTGLFLVLAVNSDCGFKFYGVTHSTTLSYALLLEEMYLDADSHLVTVNAPILVAKEIAAFELTKLKSITARNIQRNVLVSRLHLQVAYSLLFRRFSKLVK